VSNRDLLLTDANIPASAAEQAKKAVDVAKQDLDEKQAASNMFQNIAPKTKGQYQRYFALNAAGAG
jgi:hypothetical protein